MSEEIKTTDNAEMQADLDEVMRKYDRESNTRIWKGKPAVLIKILAAVFSVYCIYMTLFSSAKTEIRLPLFLGFILILGFLTYPIKKGYPKVNHMPWYDWLIMLVGSCPYFYYAIFSQDLIDRQNRITLFGGNKLQGECLLIAGGIIAGRFHMEHTIAPTHFFPATDKS